MKEPICYNKQMGRIHTDVMLSPNGDRFLQDGKMVTILISIYASFEEPSLSDKRKNTVIVALLLM